MRLLVTIGDHEEVRLLIAQVVLAVLSELGAAGARLRAVELGLEGMPPFQVRRE